MKNENDGEESERNISRVRLFRPNIYLMLTSVYEI